MSVYDPAPPPPLPPTLPPTLPVPPQPPLSRWPTVLAWGVILACATLIFASGLRPRPAETPAPGDDAPHAGPATEFVIQSRLAVGFHGIAGSQVSAPLLAGIREAARTPADRLRATAVVGAVGGRDDALAGVDAVLRQDLPPDLRRDALALRDLYAGHAGRLDPARRDELIARHAWFARLALTQHLPDDAPQRRAALAPAVRAARTATAMMVLGAVALAAGVVILVLVLVRWLGGGLPFAYAPPPPGRGGPFVEAFALYLLGMVVVSGAIAAVLGDVPLWANFLLVVSVVPALLWPRLRGLTWPETRDGFGLHAGRGLLREAGCGVLGYVAALPLLAVAVVFTSVLTRVSGATPSHPIAEQAGAGGFLHALQLYALAAVYAPVVEELLFRGAFYHHVRARLPWWLAALAVGVLFAAIHPQGWAGIPLLTTVALVLAALREWRGSIVAPVVAHACVNGVTVTMLVLMTA